MAWTRVKNRRGTSDLKRGTCPSWIRHWENGTCQSRSICGALGCKGTSVVGGHVIKIGGFDSTTYIVPICVDCNARADEFDVLWDLHPASHGYSCS